MKRMSDFIMEQEIQTTVEAEELFEESTLVSDYMNLCASAQMMECITEFATIAAFCEANEIAAPAVIQEGWADFWQGVKNFFSNIIAWFKTLVKGTIAAVTKASLPQLIGKLKTMAPDKEVKNKKIVWMATASGFVFGMIKAFRNSVLKPVIDDPDVTNGADAKTYNKVLDKIDEFISDVKAINKEKNWKDSGIIKNLESKYLPGVSIKTIVPDKYTIGDLIEDLEKINKLDVPKTGKQLLKDIEFDEKKVKELATAQADNEGGKDITAGATYKADDAKTNDKLVKKIKNAADELAKAYDKVTQGLLELTHTEFDDKEVKEELTDRADAAAAKAERKANTETVKDI